MSCINFGEVLHDVSYVRHAIALEAVLHKLHAKLAPGWVLIWVNFGPIQEIGQKVGGGPFFARLRYYLVLIFGSIRHMFTYTHKRMRLLTRVYDMNTEHMGQRLNWMVPYSHKITCQGFSHFHLFVLLLATLWQQQWCLWSDTLPHMSYNLSAHYNTCSKKGNFKNGMETHST